MASNNLFGSCQVNKGREGVDAVVGQLDARIYSVPSIM